MSTCHLLEFSNCISLSLSLSLSVSPSLPPSLPPLSPSPLPLSHRVNVSHSVPNLSESLNLHGIWSWPYLYKGDPVGRFSERHFCGISFCSIFWLSVVGVEGGGVFLVLEYGMEFSNHLVVELQLIRLILKCRRLRVCVKERERERDGERGREKEREGEGESS